MKIIQYILLTLLLWNIPTFFSYDINIGSKLSYFTYLLLLTYYFLSKKHKPLVIFLLLGLLYYVISGIVFVEDNEFYYYAIIKFFILILCGAELIRSTNNSELFAFLTLGSISILIHAFFFQDNYGRYSGFYLDPNAAGFVCLIGYGLSFSITNIKLKIIGQFLLTFAGILTFSRTFILLWILISLISIYANRKNAVNFAIGTIVIITILSIASILQLNVVRLEALESFLGNNSSNSITVIQSDSRFETWSVYYNQIIENPIFGNGYKTLSGYYGNYAGVHNTFLMILGESGVFTFLVFCYIYFNMLFKSFTIFNYKPYLFIMVFTLIGSMLTIHNYFENFIIVLTSLWLMIKIKESEKNLFISENEEKSIDLAKTINP